MCPRPGPPYQMLYGRHDGCGVVIAADSIPVTVAFAPAKKVDQETEVRVTHDALAVETPRWMIGDSKFDMLMQAVVPIARTIH